MNCNYQLNGVEDEAFLADFADFDDISHADGRPPPPNMNDNDIFTYIHTDQSRFQTASQAPQLSPSNSQIFSNYNIEKKYQPHQNQQQVQIKQQSQSQHQQQNQQNQHQQQNQQNQHQQQYQQYQHQQQNQHQQEIQIKQQNQPQQNQHQQIHQQQNQQNNSFYQPYVSANSSVNSTDRISGNNHHINNASFSVKKGNITERNVTQQDLKTSSGSVGGKSSSGQSVGSHSDSSNSRISVSFNCSTKLCFVNRFNIFFKSKNFM